VLFRRRTALFVPTQKTLRIVAVVALLGLSTSIAQAAAEDTSAAATRTTPRALSFEQVVDRVIAEENSFVTLMKNLRPVVETYVQYTKPDRQLGSVPVRDNYFLGQFGLTRDGVADTSYLKKPAIAPRLLNHIGGLISDRLSPVEFARTLVPDPTGFDRHHYSFTFVRREVLGDVPCIAIDVRPLSDVNDERLLGRIWVEDQHYRIVRVNGTFAAQPHLKAGLHFDIWRLNLLPNVWLPAYVYSEDSDQHAAVRYKALTRIWGYDLQHAGDLREFAEPLSDEVSDVAFRKGDSGYDLSPEFSKRRFQYSTEDNIIERLQIAGLMAPRGDVDQVLQQVVANLEITNDLEIQPQIRCRVLLTSPLESFSFGHTIVLSRGLIDVLPDEATLASILAHELAHIVLGHAAEERYASSDSVAFPDQMTMQKLQFTGDERQEEAANAKAMELLSKSPYNDKIAQAGLFLKALQARQPELPNLIRAHLGNGLKQTQGLRMSALASGAPELKPAQIDQIAALPLGSRIKVDPWSDRIEMRKPAAVSLNYASEKMPFEVTPLFPYLRRITSAQ